MQSHLEQMTEKVRLLENERALHADLKQLEATLRAQLRAKETALEEAKDGMNKAQAELIEYKEEAEKREKVLIGKQQALETKLREISQQALLADLKQLEATLRAQLRAKETALEEAKDGMNKAQAELIKYKEEAEKREKVLIGEQQALETKLQKIDEKVSGLLRQKIEDSSTARMLRSDLAAAKEEVCSGQPDSCQSCRVSSRVLSPEMCHES